MPPREWSFGIEVVHEYSGVDLPIVWRTIQRRLPPLVPQLRRILAENR